MYHRGADNPNVYNVFDQMKQSKEQKKSCQSWCYKKLEKMICNTWALLPFEAGMWYCYEEMPYNN